MRLISNYFVGNSRSVIVKRNIAGSFLIKGISIVISLLLVPMTLGYVSSELYGIWLTLSSIITWLGFLDVGFTLGLKNKLAEAIALDKWERGKCLVSTTYFMMILIFVPLGIILECLIPFVNWAKFLNVSSHYNVEITKVMYVLVAFFCLQMIINVFIAVVAAFQKVALSNSFTVIGNFLSLIIIYLLTKFCPPSLLALAFSLTLMPLVITLFASLFFYNGKFKSISPNIHCIRKEYIKDLFNLGYKFFIIMIQVVIMYQSTNILISNVSGPNDVTTYNIAYKYVGIAMMVYNIILTPLWPAFTDAYTKKDYVWMNNLYRKMIKVYLLSLVGMLIMLAISPIAYQIWLGNKVQMPIAMTIVVSIYMLILNWDSLHVQIINGIGKVQLQLYVTLIGICLHIPLSLILGKFVGAYGVLISMSIITIIYATFFTIQLRKLLSQKACGIWNK